MTLNEKIFYRFVESEYTTRNYKDEFREKIETFFDNRGLTGIWCAENSDPTKYILIMIYTDADIEVITDSAIAFAKEFNVDFQTIIKEVSYHFEGNKQYETTVDEYRLLFERINMVA